MSIEPTELTVEEGSTATYTAVLNTQPSGDVTVTITDPTDNTDVTTDPASLTFTSGDWDTVAAAQDDDTNDETATVTRYRMGYGEVATAPAVSISVTDTTAGVIISPAAVTVLEGHTAQYTVALKSQPTGNVTVTVNDPRDNTGVTTDPASLTFTSTNWETAQTATVMAGHDGDSATLTHTVSSTPCLRGSLKAPQERPPSASPMGRPRRPSGSHGPASPPAMCWTCCPSSGRPGRRPPARMKSRREHRVPLSSGPGDPVPGTGRLQKPDLGLKGI